MHITKERNMSRILVYGLSNNWGGVESIVMSIVERLARYCQFDIIHSNAPSLYEKKYENKNIRFVHIPTWGGDRNGFAQGLKTLLRETKYDYVWINACIMSNATILSVVKKYSDAKVITHSHGSSFEETNLIKRWVLLGMHYWNRRKYHQYVDMPCCCSFKSAEWFYGKTYTKEHDVYFVKNGVDYGKCKFDMSTREEYRRRLNADGETLVLFHAGRLTQVKNQRKLLEILQVLVDRGKKVLLLIAGVGELHDDLVAYAKELGISDKVKFLGMRHDVNCLMQAADAFLLPSFHEGFPVTIVEAQSAGLPCIVSANLSREVDITKSVKFVPINSGAETWCEEIEKFDTMRRIEVSTLVKQCGYDIEDVSNNFKNKITLC